MSRTSKREICFYFFRALKVPNLNLAINKPRALFSGGTCSQDPIHWGRGSMFVFFLLRWMITNSAQNFITFLQKHNQELSLQ